MRFKLTKFLHPIQQWQTESIVNSDDLNKLGGGRKHRLPDKQSASVNKSNKEEEAKLDEGRAVVDHNFSSSSSSSKQPPASRTTTSSILFPK